MTSMRVAGAEQEAAFRALLDEWDRLGRDLVPGWESALAEMREQELQLREAGLWRTGGRTLMHALDVHHSEVLLCRALAWVLTPDGWHGLGSRVLQGVLEDLQPPGVAPEDVTVLVEEVRHNTRADIVVSAPDLTLVIEAKVFAAEQPRQCDRLAELWADESPMLVFLTREGRLPSTAIDSSGMWQTMTWRRLAEILARSVQDQARPNPGVLELLQTLNNYGG